jgi:hypothetical protein
VPLVGVLLRSSHFTSFCFWRLCVRYRSTSSGATS